MIGKTLSHYEITEKIGAGGMGEVYRATDSKLGRDVALKILPEVFAKDPERMARFQREAQVLAQLNHANIAAIYGVEETDGARVLVLELVEGPTLWDRLRTGPLPVSEALDIACQIAEAVECAHESGVVHRDLKPANVKVTGDGRVKVLDFGLAKALEDPVVESGANLSGPDSPTLSPTLSSPITGALTGANVILGTAAYMSPEQARGQSVDRRADIWSFGVILFEMLTGRRLFDGDTVSDTIASILKTEPDWSNLPQDIPERLRELLERCLSKDPRQRLRDMGDVRLELEWIRDGKGATPASAEAEPRGVSRRIAAMVGAGLIGALAGILLWNLNAGPTRDAGPQPVSRLSVVFPDDLDIFDFSLSPNGRTLAARGRPKNAGVGEEERHGLYLRSLDDYRVRLVPRSRGFLYACFSPDGQWLAIVASEEAKSTKEYLWKVPVNGSAPPLKLLDWNREWRGLRWLPDDHLVTGAVLTGSRSGGIVRVPTDGRSALAPIPVVADGFDIESTFFSLVDNATSLPGGRHLLSWIEAWGEGGYGQNIVVLDVQTGEAKMVLEDGANPRWSDTGHLLFSRGTTLLAVPFDPDRLAVTGGPTALIDDLRINVSWAHGEFDVAANGTLVYQPGGFVGGRRRFAWLDRDFREIGPWSEDRFALEHGPFVSPDGRRFAAVFAGPDGVYDIWLSDPNRPVLQKWLEEPNRDCFPHVWSADGSRIVYESRTAAETRHYIRPVAEGPSVLLLEDRDPSSSYRSSFLADVGTTLVLTHNQSTGPSIAMLSVDESGGGSHPVETLLDDALDATISPDGRWMAYRSDTSGRWEVYLRRWHGGGRLGAERRVSTDGGAGDNVWWYTSAGGGPFEIWYMNDQKVYSVTVRTEPALTLSRPRLVAEWRPEYRYMDTLPDGRLLMSLLGEEEGPFGQISVVRGWTRELERRLDTAGPRP